MGLVMRSSSDYKRVGDQWVWANVAKTCGLNKNYNRELKTIFKGAAITVITTRESVLGQHYDRLLAAGTKPNLAKLTLARKIAAIVLRSGGSDLTVIAAAATGFTPHDDDCEQHCC